MLLRACLRAERCPATACGRPRRRRGTLTRRRAAAGSAPDRRRRPRTSTPGAALGQVLARTARARSPPVGPADQGDQLAAAAEQPLEHLAAPPRAGRAPMTAKSPSIDAEHVPGLARPGRGHRLAGGDGDRAVRARAGRPRPSRRRRARTERPGSCTASAASPCTWARGRDHRPADAVLAPPCAPRPRRPPTSPRRWAAGRPPPRRWPASPRAGRRSRAGGPARRRRPRAGLGEQRGQARPARRPRRPPRRAAAPVRWRALGRRARPARRSG